MQKLIFCIDASITAMIALSNKSNKWDIFAISKVHGMGKADYNKKVFDFDFIEVVPLNTSSGLSYVCLNKDNKWGLLELKYNDTIQCEWKLIADFIYDDMDSMLQEQKINKKNSIKMSKTNLKVLTVKHKLFQKLITETPQWWQILKNDKDIYYEIRKGSTIEIYYNGGCIIRGLGIDNSGRFVWKTHTKYLLPNSSEYIKNTESKKIQLIDTNFIDEKSLECIKSNIKKYYPNSSEKGNQGAFICQKNSCFIDSEFAFNDEKKKRIDMVWIDIKSKEICFVELKLPSNAELFDGSITNQLTKYKEFAENENKNILSYYKSLFNLKKQLNLLPHKLINLDNINDYTLCNKPLLLISNCKQEWINNNYTKINKSVSEVAWGVYYFGAPNICDKISKSSGNRHILLP